MCVMKTAYDFMERTGFAWRTRAGRDKNEVGVQFANPLESNLVIAVDCIFHRISPRYCTRL